MSWIAVFCWGLGHEHHDEHDKSDNHNRVKFDKLCHERYGIVSAIEAAGGVQTITTTMMAFPDDDFVQTECTTALQTMQRANQVLKVQTTEPWDPEASTLNKRSLVVL